MPHPIRLFTHQLLDHRDEGHTRAERVADRLLLTLVSLNAAAVVLDTVKELDQQYHAVFVSIELISLYVFTLEYLARVWSCVEDPRYQQPWVGRLRYMLTPLALIDLLAVLPFYLSLGGLNLRLARLLRVVRVLKIARYIQALHLIEHVVRRKRTELLVALGVIGVMLLLVSTLMYAIEGPAQPDKFGSIPESMWWGVATLTTVGYGDVFPITPAGKLLSGVIAVLGLGLFAIPTGILASGFSEHIQEPSVDSSTRVYSSADLEQERDTFQTQLNEAQRQIELLTSQLQMQKTIIEGKDQMLDLLRGGYNRPN